MSTLQVSRYCREGRVVLFCSALPTLNRSPVHSPVHRDIMIRIQEILGLWSRRPSVLIGSTNTSTRDTHRVLVSTVLRVLHWFNLIVISNILITEPPAYAQNARSACPFHCYMSPPAVVEIEFGINASLARIIMRAPENDSTTGTKTPSKENKRK